MSNTDTQEAQKPTAQAKAPAQVKPYDVLIAVYLFAKPARTDFDAVMELVKEKKIKAEGVVLAEKDHSGKMSIVETGDHLGRKGAEIGGGVGLVVGLFAPPLLASVVVGAGVGALLGKFAKHRVESGIEEKLAQTLPDGAATLIAIYDQAGAADVQKAVANAAKTAVAQIDGTSAKELKAGLAEAQAEMKS